MLFKQNFYCNFTVGYLVGRGNTVQNIETCSISLVPIFGRYFYDVNVLLALPWGPDK